MDKKHTASKMAAVGAIDCYTEKITNKPALETIRDVLTRFVKGHVDHNAKKYINESPVYGSMQNHSVVNHSAGGVCPGKRAYHQHRSVLGTADVEALRDVPPYEQGYL